MKPDAILINTARGGVVDEAAVAAALRERAPGRRGPRRVRQRAAAAGSPLAGCPNLLLTPHIAGVTRESNVRVSTMIAEKVAAALAGDPMTRPWRMSRSTRTCATSRRARCARRARTPRWPTRPRGRSSTRRRRVSRRTACRASPQYATHLRNGRADGAAMPRVVARARRRGLVDARCGLAFPGLRAGGRRGDRPRARFGVAFAGVDQQPPFRRRRVSPGAGGGRRAWSASRSATRRQRCQRRAAGIRSSAPTRSPRCFRARRRAPLVDRPLAVRGRARQGDGRGEGGQADSARLGARPRRPPDHRCEGRARRARCCRWAAPRARCWRSSSSSSPAR